MYFGTLQCCSGMVAIHFVSFFHVFPPSLLAVFLDSCDLSIYPKESVMEFGMSINLNCTSSCYTNLDWEVFDKRNITKGTGWISLSIANVTEWKLEPSCFVRDQDREPKKALVYVYRKYSQNYRVEVFQRLFFP